MKHSILGFIVGALCSYLIILPFSCKIHRDKVKSLPRTGDAVVEHSNPPPGMVLQTNGKEWTWKYTNGMWASMLNYSSRDEALLSAWAYHDQAEKMANNPMTNAP